MWVLVMMIGAIFLAGKAELSSAQKIDGFERYYLWVHCEDPQLPTASFEYKATQGGTVGRPLMGIHTMCVGKCGGGTVTLAAALAELPAEVKKALQDKVDKHQADAAAGTGSRLTCLGDDKKPPDTKCEPPAPPWFGPSSDCKDVQEAQIETTRTAVTVYLCGYKIFSYSDKDVPSDRLYTDAYRAALRDYFRANVGKVCCNRFRQAARTGQPCNARVDIDCDGKPNQSDVTENGMPAFEGRGVRVPDDVSHDEFPPGMTDDEIAPPAGECKDCKWELIKGKIKCNPDRTKRHSYEATWRCPLTGAVVDVVKLSKPGARCP